MRYLFVLLLALVVVAPSDAARRKGYQSRTGYVDGGRQGSVTHSPPVLKTVVFHIDDGRSYSHPQFPDDGRSQLDTTTYLDTDGSLIAQDFIGHDGISWEDDEYCALEVNGKTRIYGDQAETYPAWSGDYATYGMAWFNLAQFRTDHENRKMKIKSARLCGWLNNVDQEDAAYYGYSNNYLDGMFCVMDTVPDHLAWIDGEPGGGCDACGDPRWRDASWHFADEDTPNAGTTKVGWGSGLPWEDPGGGGVWLDDPDRLGVKSTDPIYVVDMNEDDVTPYPYYWDVTEAVQQYICDPDMVNAGFFPFATYSRGSHLYPCLGPVGHTNERMFLVIEYYDVPDYTMRWNGHPLVIAIGWDDQHNEALTISSMLDSAGWGCSIMTIKNMLDDINQDGTYPRMSVADCETQIGLNGRGGIGGHSRWHMRNPSGDDYNSSRLFSGSSYRGVFSWGWQLSGDFPPTGYDADSLAIDLQVSWLDSTFTSTPRAFAYPAHYRNIQSDLLLAPWYIGARTGNVGLVAVSGPGVGWQATGDPYGAPANALAWYPRKAQDGARRDRPVNLYSIGQFGTLCDLVGEWDETFTKAQIKEVLFTQFVKAAVDSGHAAIFLMAHTIKMNPATGLDLCGITPDEVMLINEVIDECGNLFWKAPSYEAVFRWWRSFHEPVDAPTWDTTADGLGVDAMDAVYWNIKPGAKGVR